MASLCHNLYWHQRLYGTDFLHLTFFAQNTTKTGKDVGFGISIVLNICETPVTATLFFVMGEPASEFLFNLPAEVNEKKTVKEIFDLQEKNLVRGDNTWYERINFNKAMQKEAESSTSIWKSCANSSKTASMERWKTS
jgi:hypothetical protein